MKGQPDPTPTSIVVYLSQQFEHVGRLLHPLLPEQPLDLPEPGHTPDVRAAVGPPQHPRQPVGLEHQRGEQQVSAATSLALPVSVVPLPPPLGQVDTSLSGQLGAHHSREDVSVEAPVSGGSQRAAKTSHLTRSANTSTPPPGKQMIFQSFESEL